MKEFLRRLHYLLHRRRFDRELVEEMAFHQEMAGREGRPFGNALRLREDARDAWGWTWLDRFTQDVRYGARLLRNSPGFTLAAVAMLALGIGVNIAAFASFNLMFLKPLPVRDPGTLLRFVRSAPKGGADNFPYPAVEFYAAHTRSLSAVLAVHSAGAVAEGEEKPVAVHFVTPNFLSELGGTATLGRVLDPSRDGALDADPVVVLSHGFWQRHFGADETVLGRTLRLNGTPASVVGVASREFSGLGLGAPDLWIPIGQRPRFFEGGPLLSDFSERSITVQMWGRLPPGRTSKSAEDELRSLAMQLRAAHPEGTFENERLVAEPGGYAARVFPPLYPVLALVCTLVALILAVVCANLGGLLLARGAAREREIATRIAVGAGRGRLIRQLFTESLMLGLLGSAAGLALGYLVLRSVMAWTGAPPWLRATPDLRVTAFAFGIGLLATLLFGLTPALQVTRRRARPTLTRQVLIGAQVAASCVLLIVSGLLVRAVIRASSAHPGFDYEHVITIDPGLSGSSPAGAQAHIQELDTRLRSLPGVTSVAKATNPPLGNRWTVVRAEVGGRQVGIHLHTVDPAFFETMQIPLRRGRALAGGDVGAIVVSESLARLQWPTVDPLGQPFRVGLSSTVAERTVVGIAGSARLVSPEDSDAVEVYQLATPSAASSMVVLVRTTGPAESLLTAVAATAKAVDPRRFPKLALLKDSYREKVRTSEYAALSAGLLGLVALLLACVGIVGLVAYGVAQRTKEIGIRLALGATAFQVLAAVLRPFSRPVVVGLLLGVGGAALLSQVLRQVLYGVSHLDPVAYAAATALLAIAAAIAAGIPARRALHVDPIRALRCE